jgi:hypothetical protein
MRINPIELASELAHVATQRSLNIVDSVEMYIEDENGNHVYTDEVQDEFNDWYDYYLTMIDNCSEDE